jgi:hypothetical protein
MQSSEYRSRDTLVTAWGTSSKLSEGVRNAINPS